MLTVDEIFTRLDPKLPIQDLLTETLNLIAEYEFEQKYGPKGKHQEDREAYRNGHRTRRFDTPYGTLMLKIPKVSKGSFIPSFLHRYQRYDVTLKKSIAEFYVNGVSTGKMNNVVQAMGIKSISRGQVSKLIADLDSRANEIRTRPLKDSDGQVLFIDAVFEKVKIEGKSTLTAIISVIGLGKHGKRQLLALEAFDSESKDNYKALLKSLRRRGLRHPKLIVSDGAAGLLTALPEVYPNVKWQRCRVHFIRNVMKTVKKDDRKAFTQQILEAWRTKSKSEAWLSAVRIYFNHMGRYRKATLCLMDGFDDTLTCMDFAYKYPIRQINTSNVVERLNREFRRRSRSIGLFPNIQSCIRLFTVYADEYLN